MQKLILPFLSLFLYFGNIPLIAQEKTEMSIVLLSNQIIAEVNTDEDRFLIYVKKVIDELSLYFENDLAPREIVILFNLKKDSIPEIEISSRPALSPDSIEMIFSKIRMFRPVNTKFIDFSFLLQIYTSGGCPFENIQFHPDIINPFVSKQTEYEQAGLEMKVALIKNWAKTEVLPILSAFEKKVDPQFKGVRISGDKIASIHFDSLWNVKELTDYNAFYWRGMMEMKINNFLITASKIFLHVAAGEFDVARRYLDILNRFKQDKTIADYYLDELSLRLDLFFNELNEEISKGVGYHDSGEYNKAYSVYDKILSYYPYSARTNFELFFTVHEIKHEITDNIHIYNENWNNYQSKVSSCDPLYPRDLNAQTRQGEWLLSRRLEINDLFNSGNDARKDFVNYADIALDLEAWSFAAHMYWLIFTHFSEVDYGKKKNILAHYLYSLDKLGQNDILLLFDLNYDNEFKKIEKERRKVMEASESYKAFVR